MTLRRGGDPRWSPADGELSCRDFNRIYRVAYSSTATELVPEAAELVLDVDLHNSLGLSFDLPSEGWSFLVQKPVGSLVDDRPIIVVEGWQAEVGRLGPEGSSAAGSPGGRPWRHVS